MVSADGQIEFSLFLSVGFQVLPRPTPFKGLVNRLSLRGNLVARWHSKVHGATFRGDLNSN